MKRFIEAVQLSPVSGRELGGRTFYLNGKRVSNHDYSIAWLEMHKAGRLGEPETQSTGFGYRIVTPIHAIKKGRGGHAS